MFISRGSGGGFLRARLLDGSGGANGLTWLSRHHSRLLSRYDRGLNCRRHRIGSCVRLNHCHGRSWGLVSSAAAKHQKISIPGAVETCVTVMA